MIKVKRQSLRLTRSVIIFVLVIGSLSMVWPAIISLFLGAILLLKSCCLKEVIATASWAEVGHVPSVVSLR